MNNADMPAYPMSEEDSIKWLQGDCVLAGLTKREHFAGVAMQGLIKLTFPFGADEETTARRSLKMADALLAELSKSGE
ncbi:MAG: hypothetical protein ACJAVY_001329 [Marinoscillum sp.]|jgi:hypothetical protein